MSTYEIKFYMSNGQAITVMTCNQPDDISKFTDKMANAKFQTFINDDGTAMVVNVSNVLYFEAKKVREAE